MAMAGGFSKSWTARIWQISVPRRQASVRVRATVPERPR
jgi:hypothetical protein